VAESVELAKHEYAEGCHDHMCNVVEEGFDGTVCPPPPPPADAAQASEGTVATTTLAGAATVALATLLL